MRYEEYMRLSRSPLPLALASMFGCGGGQAGVDASLDAQPDAIADVGPDVLPDANNDAGSPTAFLDACFEGLVNLEPSTYAQIQEFVHEERGVFLRIARDPADRFGTSGTSPFDLVRWAIVTQDTRFCVTDSDELAYDLTHHNIRDVAKAHDDTQRYELTMEIGGTEDTIEWSDRLTILELDSDTVVDGPIQLTQTYCRSIPAGRGCIWRQ